MKRLGLLLSIAAAGLAGALASSCQDTGGTEVFACPHKEVFTGVSPDGGAAVESVSAFMERRCGTLDCHGQSTRPMRLYGKFGLRAPQESNVAGGKATTPLEIEANYGAACSLEPEKMAQAVTDVGQSAEKLLILQKARGTEGHKGGAVVKQGTSGDECIAGWLRGDPLEVVAPQCQDAISKLE